MADWTVHTETGRLFRPIYNLSGKSLATRPGSSDHLANGLLGEPCYEWDRPGGPVTIARDDRGSRLVKKDLQSGQELVKLM